MLGTSTGAKALTYWLVVIAFVAFFVWLFRIAARNSGKGGSDSGGSGCGGGCGGDGGCGGRGGCGG